MESKVFHSPSILRSLGTDSNEAHYLPILWYRCVSLALAQRRRLSSTFPCYVALVSWNLAQEPGSWA